MYYYYYSDMPIKITYDLNNKQESKLIDDYYFFKSYITDLIFNWGNFYLSKDYDPLIIKYHLNKIEFKRFKKLYQKILIYHYGYQITLNKIDIFIDLFLRDKTPILKTYKSYIIYKFFLFPYCPLKIKKLPKK